MTQQQRAAGTVIGGRSIRDWVGAEGEPCPVLIGRGDGDLVVGCYFVQTVSVARTKNDKPYLRLVLSHRTETVECRVWENAEAIAARVPERGYVGVRARVSMYNGARQLLIDQIEVLTLDPAEYELFLPRSPHDAGLLEAQLDGFVKSVADKPLRTLLRRLLGRGTATGDRFRYAPAAKHNHHAYVAGLLEHTISVTRLCETLAAHYGGGIDRDLLVAGALVHDIGKISEIETAVGFPYSDEGKLLGHILIGLDIVRAEAANVPELDPRRLLLLLHLVASHQGRYEWQSPREPRTLEALILHYADDLDAKMHQAAALVANVDSAEGGWSAYDRSFARDFLRHVPAADDVDPTAGPPNLVLDLFKDGAPD